jgi:hypothetical protein
MITRDKLVEYARQIRGILLATLLVASVVAGDGLPMSFDPGAGCGAEDVVRTGGL